MPEFIKYLIRIIVYYKIATGMTIAAGPLVESFISDGAEGFFGKFLR